MKWAKSFFLLLNYVDKQKSTITDNWVNCASAAAAGGGSGTVDVDETSGNVSGGKYVVYKQPLSLDRVCIHDVLPQDATGKASKIIVRYILCLISCVGS